MKGRSTLILLISIVVLGGFIWLQESWWARQSDKGVSEYRLFNLKTADLLSVEFRMTNTVVRFAKENGVWMTGDPESGLGRADVELIQRMVSGLNSMGKGTTITSKHLEIRGLDSAEYGFDVPVVEITAIDNAGKHRWLVGRNTALGDMVYVKEEGAEDIYTVSSRLLAVVPTNPDLLRDRLLFPGEAASVRRMEVRGPGGFVQLVKEPQEGWRLQQPVSAPADASEVENYIQQLYRLRIEDFVRENVSDFSIYGLQGDSRQISLGGSDGTSRMLIVGDDVPDRTGFVYARRADDTSVFTLSAEVLKLLNINGKRFRDARVIDLALGDITSVGITKGDESLKLQLDPSNGWNIVSPVAWAADPAAVTELAKIWTEAVFTEFDVKTNAAPAEWILEFGSGVSGVTNRIEILPALGKKDGLLVRRTGEKTLYQINLAEVPVSIIDPLTFKDTRIWALDKEGIDKIAVHKTGQPTQVVQRQEDRTFALAETNSNVKVNAFVFSRFLEQLSDVNTSGYIAYNPSDLDIYGLSDPLIELHVGLSATNELGRVLLIGRETPEGFYSMVKGRDVVFFLEKPIVKILSANLVSEPKAAEPVNE